MYLEGQRQREDERRVEGRLVRPQAHEVCQSTVVHDEGRK